MLGHNLQTRFIVPVACVISFAVLGGALLLASIERAGIVADVAAKSSAQINDINQLLAVTDALMTDQTHRSMRLMLTRAEALGQPALGQPVRIGTRIVPELLLGPVAQTNNNDLVDGITRINEGYATLFVRSGNDFVRIATTVKNGAARATGSLLDPRGQAYRDLLAGQSYYGYAEILGTPYLTGYEPLKDRQGHVVGAVYVGYQINLAALEHTIGASRLLQHGFMAIIDEHGTVRFHSDNVDAGLVSSAMQSDEWQVDSIGFDKWGTHIIAAYPHAEVTQRVRDKALAIVLPGIGLCVLLVALASWLLKRLVLAPLGGEPQAAIAAAEHIATGDLTREITVHSGLEGSLMAALARMQQGLRGIVGSIQHNAAVLRNSATELSTLAGQVTESVEEQHDATSSIAAAIEQISVSIRQVSDSAGTADQQVNTAGTLAEDGNRTVAHAVAAMTESAQAVNRSANEMTSLNDQVMQIGNVAEIIKDIAAQTNLLALNAAIEAARAGEAGRGFAVVADEVRKLAERTTKSTGEIAVITQAIQHGTTQVIAGITEGASQVNGCVSEAEQARNQMGGIAASTGSAVEAVGVISHAIREQVTAIEQIGNHVQQIVAHNSDSHSAVGLMRNNAHQVTALAGELEETVGRFSLTP
jgi:methyl-accepting chemotaxis protein